MDNIQKNKKIFMMLNLMLILGLVMSAICYAELGSLEIKSVTSMFFVLLGIANLIYSITMKSNIKFSVFMVCGLSFSMMGDIVLEIYFMAGAILFAVGHILYFVAYCFYKKLHWLDAVVSIAIAIPSVLIVVFVPVFNYGGLLMELVCALYALIISFMLGKTVANFIRERNMTNFILMLGSFLFFFSDLMLLFHVFANISPVFDAVCLATYFPAQAFLGWSILLNANEKIENKTQQN